jgi:hypothetical protein
MLLGSELPPTKPTSRPRASTTHTWTAIGSPLPVR